MEELVSPINSDIDENEDKSLNLAEFNLVDDEVDINIHFHCEHCFKISKCLEPPKIGWSCEIAYCKYGCGMRFHNCKFEEHELLCTHIRKPCINHIYGCPKIIPRHEQSNHLPVCPASVIVCNSEWNRWMAGSVSRERISIGSGVIANFCKKNIDVAFAINDQKCVNEMLNHPKFLRQILCNKINKRFPVLPLTVQGSNQKNFVLTNKKIPERELPSRSSTEDDENNLTPGLSLSVCTELLKQNQPNSNNGDHQINPIYKPTSVPVSNFPVSRSTRKRSDDIQALCCTHGIMKDMCYLCRNDPEEPDFIYKNVWREVVSNDSPGVLMWKKLSRIETIRERNSFGNYSYRRYNENDEEFEKINENFWHLSSKNVLGGSQNYNAFDDEVKTHFEDVDLDDTVRNLSCFEKAKEEYAIKPSSDLSPKSLILELEIKKYSKHESKPKTLLTFQCLQAIRRDQFCSHYQNIHCEIQEGLDNTFFKRCPLHIYGCSFSVEGIYSRIYGEIHYCPNLSSFYLKNDSFKNCDYVDCKVSNTNKFLSSSVNGYVTNPSITDLPFEIMQYIVMFLDNFSFNNLSLTCSLMRNVCETVLDKKGLVIPEWQGYRIDGRTRWKIIEYKWFFSKAFSHVNDWRFKNEMSISNHLKTCIFNVKTKNSEKFFYSRLSKDNIEMGRPSTISGFFCFNKSRLV